MGKTLSRKIFARSRTWARSSPGAGNSQAAEKERGRKWYSGPGPRMGLREGLSRTAALWTGYTGMTLRMLEMRKSPRP